MYACMSFCNDVLTKLASSVLSLCSAFFPFKVQQQQFFINLSGCTFLKIWFTSSLKEVLDPDANPV